MQVIINGRTEDLSWLVIVLVRGWGRRGMLATPMQGDSGGVHDVDGAARGTDDAARRAAGARGAVPGGGIGAGPSRAGAMASGVRESTAAASESESE